MREKDTPIAQLDLDVAFPYSSLPAEERKRVWEDDGLHPSPAGYDAIANSIYTLLTEGYTAHEEKTHILQKVKKARLAKGLRF